MDKHLVNISLALFLIGLSPNVNGAICIFKKDSRQSDSVPRAEDREGMQARENRGSEVQVITTPEREGKPYGADPSLPASWDRCTAMWTARPSLRPLHASTSPERRRGGMEDNQLPLEVGPLYCVARVSFPALAAAESGYCPEDGMRRDTMRRYRTMPPGGSARGSTRGRWMTTRYDGTGCRAQRSRTRFVHLHRQSRKTPATR